MRTARSSSRLLGGGSASVHAGIPPQVWAWRPPWVWAWRPPRPDPLTSPWVWAWRPARHAGIPRPQRPARHAGIPPPPHGQNSWHTLLKILPCPNFVVGGKYRYSINATIAFDGRLASFLFLSPNLEINWFLWKKYGRKYPLTNISGVTWQSIRFHLITNVTWRGNLWFRELEIV